jgi:hypothetical protein
LSEGDKLFIRYEINHEPNQQSVTRYALVIDDRPPVVSGVAIFSNNERSPLVARATNFISVIVEADEPVRFGAVKTARATAVDQDMSFFIYSGVNEHYFMSSGFSDATVGVRAGSFSSDAYSTMTYGQLGVQVSPNDIEGFFGFSGLIVLDRAGNPTRIVYSSGADSFNKIWVDPVAPKVTDSGILAVPTLGSGAVTTSGTLTTKNLPLYHVSGLFSYSFDVFERDNEITEGELKYKLSMIASGVGTYSGGTGSFNLINETIAINEDTTSFSGLIDTTAFASGIYNGLYVLRLELEDYVGNETIVEKMIYIDNALFISTALIEPLDEEGYIVELRFNTFFETSGTDLLLSDLSVLFTGDKNGQSIQVNLDSDGEFNNLVLVGTSKFLTFEIKRDLVDFASMNDFKVTIKTSGVVKFKEPILNLPLDVNGDGVALIVADIPSS